MKCTCTGWMRRRFPHLFGHYYPCPYYSWVLFREAMAKRGSK